MRWQEGILGDFFRIKHGYAFKSEYFSDEGEFILLTPGNFFEEGGFKHKGEKETYYTGDIPESFILKKDDLIIAMTEQMTGLLGSSALIPADNRYLHNQRLGLVYNLDAENLDRRFLYYLFNTVGVRHQISASASGTKVRHTAPDRIYRVQFRRPPITIQRKIAAILSAYDDLIENNLKRIALLEEAARLLYREWFVRLRFPGHEHTCIVDGVPKGWAKKELRDICREIRQMIEPDEVEPDTPYIGLEHMPRRSITLNDWGSASAVQSTKHVFVERDILFGKIRPYFHKVGVCFTDGVASSDAIVIRPNTPQVYGLVLMTVSSDLFVSHATQSSYGAKMPRANWKVLEKYVVALPSERLLKEFSEFVQNIVSQLRLLVFQNRKLKQARDLLLPRLMSGELTVDV